MNRLLLVAFFYLLYFNASSVNGAEFNSHNQQGYIGTSSEKPIDNPADNIFHVNINQELCGDEIVWLTYEVSGVADHYSISRSINDQIAIGGRKIQYSSEWSIQRERVSVDWLKSNDNVIRFSVPESNGFGYSIRNVKFEITESSKSVDKFFIEEPKYYRNGEAYIKGYIEGTGQVRIDGNEIKTFNGQFETLINAQESILLEASFNDGSQYCETIILTKAESVDQEFSYSYDVLKTRKYFETSMPGLLTNSGAAIDVPSDALTEAKELSINTLRVVDIPALDAGLINVTASTAGFRFLPHGTSFQKESIIRLPYDTTMIPDGYTVKDIKTYFFDELSHHWVPLPTDTVLTDESVVLSKTTHFTDMINGIIQVPESPEVNAYNSTSMKGIKAANPTAGINLMQPPSANSMGNANMSYPLNIPAGRNGMQPQLALSYSNAGGNSWMGLGWNMSLPSVSIDTRWGVPRYMDSKESETYLLNGQQLSPVAHRSAPENRTSNKIFHPRIEGAFQRIIRRGNSTSTYWWEVTDKNGTIYTYGKDDEAVLTDADGNRTFWSLQEVKDLNGNSVKYEYEKTEDSGTGDGNGSVKGYELYCSKITYTNHSGQEGKYSIHFLRNTDGERRPDVTIDGRLGFKRVTADRLTKVEVKYNNKNVRHYEFKYVIGAFYKSLLGTIEEYDAAGKLFTTHELTYYDEVREGELYKPLKGEESWNPGGGDDVIDGFVTGKAGFNYDASALTGNKSSTFGFGMTVSVGYNDNKYTSKSNTFGGSGGYSQTDTEGRVFMIDINGDALPDKVILGNGEFYYRANLSGSGDNSDFSEPIQIVNGPGFYEERSKTSNVGFEAQGGFGDNASAFVGSGYSNTKSITSVYFTDVNGDQLTDVVKKGRVYFNSYDKETGIVTFTQSSENTPNPIDQSVGVASDIFEVDQDEIDDAIDSNPLHDVVRMWRAPFDGTISIDAPVKLIAPAEVKDGHDGVHVTIQHKNNVLWERTISAGDFSSHTPSGLNNVNISKGDQLYFRVQSVENGEDDKVQWTPSITYLESNLNLRDANSKKHNEYSAQEDFILSSPIEITAPIDGHIEITGNFVKPKTTDSVRVVIVHKNNLGEENIIDNVYSWNDSANDPITASIDVEEGDSFLFKVVSATNVDWSAITWNPELYYSASYDPGISNVTQNGKNLIEFFPVPYYSIFANTLDFGSPWLITESIDSLRKVNGESDSIRVSPKLRFPEGLVALIYDGKFTFSAKKKDSLLLKQELTVINGQLTSVDTFKIAASLEDSIYFEYHIENEIIADGVLESSANVIIGDSTFTAETGLFTVYSKANDFIFGPLYRGWGHFAYNGNRERANQKINEAELVLNDKFNSDYQSGDINDTDDLSSQQPYSPADEKFILLYANREPGVWSGYDKFTYLDATTISSSRYGDDDIRPFLAFDSEAGASIRAINKISRSQSISASGGGSLPGVSGSANISTGWSDVLTDFMDLNGDRYPDIVTKKGVQFTLPTGNLESNYENLSSGDFSKSTTYGDGVSVGGFYKMEPKGTNTNIKPPRGDAGGAKVSGTINANYGTGTNTGDFSWMDVNGDGLPDKVRSNGMVALNLGYKLAAEEQWYHGEMQKSESKSAGGGLGFSKGVGSESSSISGGVGVSLSSNKVIHSIQDMNGDGLADEVFINNGVKVKLNTGNGFDDTAYLWAGAEALNESSTTSESANFAFTGCIPLPIPPPPSPPLVKLCFNPSGNGGQSASRDLKKFTDIDGDGFPDFLSSTKDNNLKIKRSTIARTNMLKTVSRPLGASFTLDYKPEGSTYENPNTIWTLSKVEVYDGFAGDGVDTIRTKYVYNNGRYNRHEREFYGFDKVISNTLDTQNGDVVYTSVTQIFSNNTYYNKGLLLIEIMTDGEGNKFVEKVNNYKIKDLEGNFLADDFNSDAAVAFPALVRSEQKFYEGQEDAGKSTSTEYNYNAIGNVIQYTDFGDIDPDDDLIATIKYHDYDGLYIKAAPSEIVVESTTGALRKRQADIDGTTGNVTQIRQYLEDETMAAHDLEYDSYGNLSQMTRPSNVKGQRLSLEYEYDNVVHQFVTKVSNSYGYSSEATYDFAFGQVLESKDLNGNKITYELDDLGRVVKIVGPYEQQGAPYTIKFEYHPEATVPWALTKHYDPQNNNNDLETAIFVDGIGRVLQTKKDGAIYQGEGKTDTEMMIVSGRVLFDAFGRTTEAYYPTLEDTGNQGDFNVSFDTVDPTLTTYDVLNRALTVSLPDGALTKTEYGFGRDRDGRDQFRTKTIDANGVATEQFTDVRGRVTAVKNITGEGDVWTSFTYNAINEQVAATDDMDNTTVSTYDWFGRRVMRNHPDAGITTYSYDLAGNLTELVTANLAESGGAITYDYEFERLTDITYPENVENNVHYTYGEAGAEHNRAGRIVIQEDATGAQEFFYGPLGEVIKNVRTVVIPKFDEQTYVTEWSYDTWNRLESMTYADGEEVSYHYNAGGLLHSMEGKKKGYKFNYVNQLGYDKFEQRVYLEYGNGTKTNYTYESDRRRLKTMIASTAANRNFMDNEYSYDLVNNILGLKNNAQVPNPNLMGGNSEYSYEYDDLYRLVRAEGKYTGTGDNADHSYNLEMSYNTVGGITQKNQLHTSKGQEQKKTTYNMTYTYGEEQPHAPTHIGQQAYTYDANGNQTGWTHDVSGQRREILWDEENRIRTISDNGADHHYVYDAAGTRVLKAKGIGQSIYINGKRAAGSGNMGNYTVYVNPYLVLKSGGYTKHYYIEGQRIVSKLGGGFDNNGQGPLKAGNDKVNYNTKHQELFDGIVRNQKFLAPDGTILTAGKSGKIPPGQILGDNPNNAEQFQYFFHPDHLGSTSYITDAAGEVYQHLEYFAFGETFVEEHSNTHRTPYLFNGKELDEETGLYYYGARYYEAQTSIFLGVDRFAEKYPGLTPYAYVANNPMNFTDPTGDTIVVNNVGKIIRNDKTDNLVYMSGKDGKMSSIGKLGGQIDANEIYKNLLEQNMEEAESIYNPFTFRNKVKNKGDWDYKNNKKTIYGLANDGKTKFNFQGKSMESQDIGNHHFGAVALAYGLFPNEEFILKKAGEAQIAAGTSRPEWQNYKEVKKVTFTKTGRPIYYNVKVIQAPYGDDPRDQYWIKNGFQHYKNNK